MGTPATDADWLYGCAVLFVPVEDVRIGHIRSAVGRGQSTDAAPVTESLVLYTLLRLYDYCAAGYTLSWTFCDTVLENLHAPEQWLRRGILPVYRTMEGAALVDDRVGVTFDVELCVPWDAPEAVVDINSADVVTLGSVPDKVGLFGRRKDAAASRILQGRDSRSVRFLVPDVRGVDQNFHDVTIVDMDDKHEPKITLADLSHLRDSWPPGILNHMKWSQQNLELMRKEDIEDSQHQTIRPTLDSVSGTVDGVAATGTLRHIDRYYAIQLPRFVANTPLQSLPGRVATHRISGRLHDAAPCPLADATKYEWGASVVTGVCTRGDTHIQEAGTSAFSTGACDVGGGR